MISTKADTRREHVLISRKRAVGPHVHVLTIHTQPHSNTWQEGQDTQLAGTQAHGLHQHITTWPRTERQGVDVDSKETPCVLGTVVTHQTTGYTEALLASGRVLLLLSCVLCSAPHLPPVMHATGCRHVSSCTC